MPTCQLFLNTFKLIHSFSGTNQANYIDIKSLYGCLSYVGMIGGNQTYNLRQSSVTCSIQLAQFDILYDFMFIFKKKKKY